MTLLCVYFGERCYQRSSVKLSNAIVGADATHTFIARRIQVEIIAGERMTALTVV
jgi:hypothetical protein